MSSPRGGIRHAVIAVRDDPWTSGAALLAGLITAGIVFATLRSHLGTDFDPHVGMTARAIRTGVFPGDFLFYLLNAVFAGFSTDYWTLKLSLVFIIAVATTAKAWLSIRFLVSETDRAGAATLSRWVLPLAAALGVLLNLTFSLPGGQVYLGQIPPNVWHNSTTMALMPFAVALFWSSLAYLRDPQRRWLWTSLALAAFNIATKPSFVLCFIPIFPLAAIVRYRLTRPALEACALTAACGALILLQYLYIYVADPTSSATEPSSGIAVSPFHVWHAYSNDIPRSVVMSFVFPLAALLLGGRSVWSSVPVRYALALTFTGVVEFSLLTETGLREFDGNFLWQAIVTNYLLFLATAAALVPWVLQRGAIARKVVITVAFLAHVWAAYHFLDHFFATRSLV